MAEDLLAGDKNRLDKGKRKAFVFNEEKGLLNILQSSCRDQTK